MNADYDAWSFVSADRSEAVCTYVQITAEANMKSRRLRLAGLDPETVYCCELNGKTYEKTGAYLMQCGVMLPNLWGDMQSVQFRVRKKQ